MDGSYTDPALSDVFTPRSDTNSTAVPNMAHGDRAPDLGINPELSNPPIASGAIAESDHKRLGLENLEDIQLNDRESYHAQYLTRLCELNVALYRHMLYTSAPTGDPPPPQMVPSTGHGPSISPSPRLADLKIGQLLSMSVQLRNLVRAITYLDGRSSGDDNYRSERLTPDRSTALVVLSCYSRLEKIYSRTLDALRAVQSRGQPLEEADRLIPSLSIGGFSLAACGGVQLSFVIQLCEQNLNGIHDILRKCGEDQVRQDASTTNELVWT